MDFRYVVLTIGILGIILCVIISLAIVFELLRTSSEIRKLEDIEDLRARLRLDPQANVSMIRLLEQSLGELRPERDPKQYADHQNSLGAAYFRLLTGDRRVNLERAITCYQEALRFWTPETDPLDYALAQINLGTAYFYLPTGDRLANLKQAISCYQEALRVQTPESSPVDYARVNSNLGLAYEFLPEGDRDANLRQAITYYQEALRFRTPETAPLEYAITQRNLGLAYSSLTVGDRTANREVNMKQAIACYQKALRFLTPEIAPHEYAITQHALGLFYIYLFQAGEDRDLNLRQVITCNKEALRFLTPETAPREYAMTQNNLGLAYSSLTTEDYTANMKQAIACYQEALLFQSPETDPSECRRTNKNLADLHFAMREWKLALEAYRVAILAGEQLYRIGLSLESKAIEAENNSELYHQAAFAAVRCGETAEALLILERGKTRLLTEALHLRVKRPPQVPDVIWNSFEQAGAAVRAAQVEKTFIATEVGDLVEAYEAQVQDARAANAALDAAISSIRIYAPHFLAAIDLPTVKAQVSDKQTALIAFCITEQGSIGFVVSQHDLEEIQVVEVPTFTKTHLRHLFAEWDADGRLIGGWLGAYDLIDHTATAFEAWQETITWVLAELGERLLTPILSALSADIERIILLPSAELFLFPLHAVPLSGNASKLLCDCYQVSYTPSIEALSDMRAKIMQGVVPDLYAVINPEDDHQLVFTPAEGSAIAQLFPQSHRTIDIGPVGTKQHVIDGMQGRTYVHFSCHGSYDWNEPTASGLELTDGRLTLADLQQGVIDLSTVRLVTLSACETGITDVLGGRAEEYVGIPAGFLLAGVPCVVSSLWAVPDLSTALLMERFYRNCLNDGMEFAAALREAQVWTRELSIGEVAAYEAQYYQQSTQNEAEKKELLRYMLHYRYLAKQNPTLRPFAHPHYWAAFIVNGM